MRWFDKVALRLLPVVAVVVVAGSFIRPHPNDSQAETSTARQELIEQRQEAERRREQQLLAQSELVLEAQDEVVRVLLRLAERAHIRIAGLDSVVAGGEADPGDPPAPEAPTGPEGPAPLPTSPPDVPPIDPSPTPDPTPTPNPDCLIEVGPICVGLEPGKPTSQP